MYQNTYCIDISMLRLVHLGTEYGVSRGGRVGVGVEVGGEPAPEESASPARSPTAR
jgi:hypothetical protein